MDAPPNITTVAHVIQQAVAPVFLLTGVGAILGVLTNRLARVVDRFRALEDAGAGDDPGHWPEIGVLHRRRHWIHLAITLCTLCALLVCLVIATLFIAFEIAIDPARVISGLFIGAMFALILGLLCFLREVTLAALNVSLPAGPGARARRTAAARAPLTGR